MNGCFGNRLGQTKVGHLDKDLLVGYGVLILAWGIEAKPILTRSGTKILAQITRLYQVSPRKPTICFTLFRLFSLPICPDSK